MKITMVHGQNHKGSTWHVADELLKNIDADYTLKEFFLPKDLNHFCLGCYACVKSREQCPFWEDKAQLDTALREADLLIFTTPTYCMMPSAPMKAFIDLFFTNWMSHKPCEEMFAKRAVIISTAAGAGAKKRRNRSQKCCCTGASPRSVDTGWRLTQAVGLACRKKRKQK